MTLAAGARLGPYEIASMLGAGGRGEVYRARDTRLERTVAIKVLPSSVADSPDRRARFEREARAISTLNHPHICTLHDIGQHDGVDFLVMEYLEGETLAERLQGGPLPLEQVLRYGSEMAGALDRAHRAGIVHRDLKPGNVMLTKSGVKLLDFGLAKLRADGGAGTVSAMMTAEKPLTGEGTLLGTLPYMSPEQVEGKDADARSDIWALGTVLYEMATGTRAFEGKSQASLIGAILKDEPPPITSRQPLAPTALDRVVKACLAKDPDERWQSAQDLASELAWIAADGGVQAAIGGGRRATRLVWVLGLACALALGTLLSFALRPGREPQRLIIPVRFQIAPPDGTTFTGPVAVSPDGTRILFLAAPKGGGPASLWIRSLDAVAPQRLPATEGANQPFWSPDGRFIGFFADRKLKRIDDSGGSARIVWEGTGDSADARGGTWNGDDVIAIAPNFEGALLRVPASGGEATPITTLDRGRGEYSHRWPHFLPDGRHFLYVALAGGHDANGIYVGSLDSKQTSLVIRATSAVAYAPPGYLLYAPERSLAAQPFDPKSLKLSGEAASVGDQLLFDPQMTAGRPFSVSANGTLAYRSGGSALTQLTWLDRQGNTIGSIASPGEYHAPRLSPDGKRLAVTRIDVRSARGDVWVIDVARGAASRLVSDASVDTIPVWSADASRILFNSYRGADQALLQKSSHGGGSEEVVLQSGKVGNFQSFFTDSSPDGRFVAFDTLDPTTNLDVWILPLEGDRRPARLIGTPAGEWGAEFSPDGRWLAYQSNESGEAEVYVQAFSATSPVPVLAGERWQVSAGGGRMPTWSRDGKEMFYLGADGKLMAVDVKTAPSFATGRPVALFDARMKVSPDRQYDVSPDGQRFLVRQPLADQVAAPMTVVLDWAAGLPR